MSLAPHRRKLRKSNRRAPSGLDDEVAKAIYDLEMNNRKLKNALTPLHINTAKEISTGASRRCVVVFYPLRYLRKMHKIQAVLGSELEKKFSGKQFVFVSQRKVQQRPSSIYKLQQMDRSRTTLAVHDSILEDLVYPSDVVARRTRFLVDGSKQLKVFLDAKEKEKVENRLDTFSAVYKRLTGKDTTFGFMTNAALQQVLCWTALSGKKRTSKVGKVTAVAMGKIFDFTIEGYHIMEAMVRKVVEEMQIPIEAVQELQKAFSLFDKDGEGRIRSDELGYTMRMHGLSPTEEDVKNLIKGYDAAGTGHITFDSFIEIMIRVQKGDEGRVPEEEVKQAFMTLDRHGDGFLSAAQLRRILTTLGEPLSHAEVDEIIRLADCDGDGQITYESLVNVMCQ